MKKVKYYYSEGVHVRMLPVITDAEGNPMYIPNAESVKIKNLPRVTVAAIWDTDTNYMNFGVSVCAPNDVFKKSIGREIATKRAIEEPEVTIRLTKRGKTRETSKRYANQLISQYLDKYVRTDI